MISGFCWVLITNIIGSLSQLSTQTVEVYQQLEQWGHARVRKGASRTLGFGVSAYSW
jgi:hypothetical protein